MTKHYAKRRENIRAAQWLGEMTPDVAELIGERKAHIEVDRQLVLGNGWYARVGDWINSASGEDLSVIGDEVFRKIYEEVDETGRALPPNDDEREDQGASAVSDSMAARTPLEIEVTDLRRRLDAVEERVRLDANAHAFLRGDPRVREGDYCLIDGFPTRVTSIASGGKWTYFNGRNSVEPFRVPPSDDIQRLYTVAEVAEIVAKVRQEAAKP